MEKSIDLLTRSHPPFTELLYYGKHPSQFGELRIPELSGPHPLIIAIHGGWWRSSHGLETQAHQCAALMHAGFATWNIEYRRLGEDGGGWPGTLLDVSAAIDFVAEIALSYDIDLSRIITVGFSAGGHLALWAAVRDRLMLDPAPKTKKPVNLKGAVSLAGAVDLVRCANLHLSAGVVSEFLGGSPQEVPERYASTSPKELLPLNIPHTLIHGTDDTSIPYEISEVYHIKALANGDSCQLIKLPETQHFELIDPLAPCWGTVLSAISLMA
ncbi:MAG: alpha/beta hydrolase [Candidatus Thiodiazotropha sp.]